MQTRREFVETSAGLLAIGAAPTFLQRAAVAAGTDKAARILVVVQLTGGNDGLNTVIPFRDHLYRKNRPGIGIPEEQTLKLGKQIDVALHPRLTGVQALYDQGKVAIVQGVGYPRPNRSHFRSMDTWHTARPEAERTTDGWLGRALEALPNRDERTLPALALGVDRLPLALLSGKIAAPAIRDLGSYRLDLGSKTGAATRRKALDSLLRVSGETSDLDFVRRVASTAVHSADRLLKVEQARRSAVRYPQTQLAQQLEWISKAIQADLGSRVFYLSLDGFDTHSKQQTGHATLLAEFSDAVKAFFDDLAAHRLDDRVMLASFSEFGRRVKENASLGTDHGAASQMFLVSGKLRAGVHGKHPSLEDLDEGDLRHHTDFRCVYAGLLEHWLGIASSRVLDGKFSPIAIV